MNSKPSQIKITGLLTPFAMDKNGRPVSLKLMAYGEEEYLVVPGKDNDGIWNHTGEFVEIHGDVTHTGKGSKQIAVRSFTTTG